MFSRSAHAPHTTCGSSRRCCWRIRALLALMLLCAGPGRASAQTAATDAQIQAAVDRGLAYLRKSLFSVTAYRTSLAVLALVKAGEPKDNPDVQKAFKYTLDRFDAAGTYRPVDVPVYVSGVDLMLLEAMDPVRYKPQMEAIVNWLMQVQFQNGAWGYLTEPNQGDTSQTQYALLGLWTASRAGIRIPTAVWDRAAQWHISTQTSSGGFIYHPVLGNLQGSGTHSMTVAATGSLFILRSQLYPGGKPLGGEQERTQAPRRKFGVLDGVDLDKPETEETESAPMPDERARTPLDAIDRAARGGVNWLASNYGLPSDATWRFYYLYGLERMTALGDLPLIGGNDWYRDGAGFCLVQQAATGEWPGGGDAATSSTSFAILFLTRATNKLLNRVVATPSIDGGLLAGGRGLPDNLNEVQVKGGEVKARPIAGPLDELLAALEKADDASAGVESVQEALVEQFQIGDREQLVGQTERLKKLVTDKRAEVRRTALWALGRGNDLRVAPLLIAALSDEDVDVMVEARNALCVLSRKPRGVSDEASPLAALPEDASEARRATAIQEWQKAVTARWHAWYLSVRPYNERDDLVEAIPAK